jgi:NADPH-dependent 2,4-dienoyl-CoA reductase/sulfur reductase-like enzyme
VVNPEMGREYLLNEKIKQTEKPKKILIIGAGPAGLSAARTAALKGDKPIIIEEKGHIGGMAKAASAAPGRKEVADIIDYFENQLEKLKVKILLNTPLNQKIIDEIKPDKAIMASGSLADIPLIKGISKTDMQICAVYDILLKKSVCGYNVIIIGGDRAGLTTADYLAEKGKKVVVLHKDKHFAQDMSANDRYYLRERLKKRNITLYKEATIKEILKDGVIFKYKGEKNRLAGFDTLALSDAMQPIKKSAEIFKKNKIEFEIIGDAKTPRDIMLSITEGEESS